MNNRLKLVGQRFGRLTVIEFSHADKYRDACWKCKCDCGEETITTSGNLKGGHTKSCGCLQKEFYKKQKFPNGESARNRVLQLHKDNAKRRNIEQVLTDEQIIAIHKENCYYCGSPPSNISSPPRCNGPYIYNGIDRIDNTKGYTINNVVSCCKGCNFFKRKYPYDEFLDKIKRIHSHLNL